MAAWIRELCALSILCGAALSLAPAGSAQKAMRFVCSIVLLAFVLGEVGRLDLEEYAVQTALLREREREFLEENQDLRSTLERRVIEAECGTYIMDKAAKLGLQLRGVGISAQWSTDGVWVPYSVSLYGEAEETIKQRLGETILTDLGIPAERQEWIGDG